MRAPNAIIPGMPDTADKTVTPTAHRGIRSFVRRAGRITPAQQRALEQLWPRYGVEYSPSALDLPSLFGNAAPCTLEIGFGNGEHLLERAQAEPERNFLGIEVHPPGVGHLLLAAEKAQLQNLRVIAHDAVEVLRWQIQPAGLGELQLLFPDPWPKKRHHKRRIVSAEFLQLVASRLIAGGRVHMATDWEPYAEEMLRVLGECTLLRNCAADGGFCREVAARGLTRFERRGNRLGHQVRELVFERC